MKIVLFSDIHTNLPALQAFFNSVEAQKPDALYCLGDLVGYHILAAAISSCIYMQTRTLRTPVASRSNSSASTKTPSYPPARSKTAHCPKNLPSCSAKPIRNYLLP